ncbi:DUF4352 domain-containing protein [Haloplanus sp. C73]|uniref:DUF4352 domain-containing protein n=1 Tax=Haloplanus sp. C73 TaxID=3421641 RepID=UPI003EC055BC
MERRHLLTGCGTVLAGLLAGCGGGGGADSTATATDAATATATETATATATETEAPTETATATATPGPDGPTHDVDDSFTVGTGQEAIGYRITNLFRTPRIGGEANFSEADGTFLIVVLDFSNPQDESISFPNTNFFAWNENQRRYLDDEATPKITEDDRIDVESIATATVLAGNTKTGAVLFDLDPEQSYWLRVQPTGDDGETHYVRIGTISEIEELQGSITS